MVMRERKQTCFVVMPFGEKKDADGEDIDFDDIYRFFFRRAIESLGLECIRCDEIAEAGSIHEKMFESLYKADVVVVDITSLNANVFYELGIRHTLAKCVTVLIRRKGTILPFNIQGLQVVEYDQKKFASIERAKERILDIIKNGLNVKKNDSPVHAILSLNIGTEPKPISETKKFNFPLINSKKSICLVTGELQNVKGIEVWVNPENTEMKMSRPLDNTISGIIRHLGYTRVDKKEVDTIATELRKKMVDEGKTSVEAGDVIITIPGNLEKTHHVKMIFHVAAFIGQFAKGYSPIPDIHVCVEKALAALDEYNDHHSGSISTLLFPLMGTGVSNRDFEERIKALLDAAIDYLERCPASKIETVYFLNYSDREFETCDHLLVVNPKVVNAPEPVPESDIAVKATQGEASKPARGQGHHSDSQPTDIKELQETKKKPSKEAVNE